MVDHGVCVPKVKGSGIIECNKKGRNNRATSANAVMCIACGALVTKCFQFQAVATLRSKACIFGLVPTEPNMDVNSSCSDSINCCPCCSTAQRHLCTSYTLALTQHRELWLAVSLGRNMLCERYLPAANTSGRRRCHRGSPTSPACSLAENATHTGTRTCLGGKPPSGDKPPSVDKPSGTSYLKPGPTTAPDASAFSTQAHWQLGPHTLPSISIELSCTPRNTAGTLHKSPARWGQRLRK